jgi:two-component system alkaline phosphatase synthesis response regulator PhoP
MARILLADDHPHIVRLLEVSLRAEGHEVLTAFDGRQALCRVREERPDLVILDVKMPELDGLRVLNRIKTDDDLRHTVVIMLTVSDHPGEMALGLDIGADYYLSKPFRPTEVTALVRRICEQIQGSDQTS